jgi:fibronectin type 3 domain-containing protein
MPKTVYLSISGYTGAYYCEQRIKGISVQQNKEKLATPEVTVVSKKKNTAVVSWEKVKNADKYVVYRSSSKYGTLEKIKETSNLKFTDKKVKGGKTYYYTVLAYNEKGSYLDSALSYIEAIKIKN